MIVDYGRLMVMQVCVVAIIVDVMMIMMVVVVAKNMVRLWWRWTMFGYVGCGALR